MRAVYPYKGIYRYIENYLLVVIFALKLIQKFATF